MQVKDVIPETFGLFKKQLQKRPFELHQADEVDAATELETLFLENHDHYKYWRDLPHGKKPGKMFYDRCIEDFSKLAHRALAQKNTKIAALGCVYLDQAYMDYAIGLEDKLNDPVKKRLDTIFKKSQVKFHKIAITTSVQDDENANARDMLAHEFYETQQQIQKPMSQESINRGLINLLGGKQKRQVS